MNFTSLPLHSTPDHYGRQAADLGVSEQALAHEYGFDNWPALADYAAQLSRENSPILPFESAVDALIAGDASTLTRLLHENPTLAQAGSLRPHRATLLHYIAANGVEQYRQKSPANAVEIAKILLNAGADVNAAAHMYGAEASTLEMLVSSAPPYRAGVQIPLVETLLDFGASNLERALMTALAHGYQDAAQTLATRGAPVDNLAAAAGLGRIADVRSFLPASDPDTRHRALAFAAQHGHADIVLLLLDAGEDPNRFNPAGAHPHSTPLHQAALAGHRDVVQLLVQRGARLDIEDKMHQGSPLGWALHAGQADIADYLRAHSG